MDETEQARMRLRLEELGPRQVADLAAVDAFPHTWRLGVGDWLREEEKGPTQAAQPE